MKTDLKQSLNRGVDQLPHPSFSDIADPPVQKMKTMDRFTAQEERSPQKQSRRFYRYAVPVFLCLLLALPGFGYIRGNLLVDSTIDLDVNPSIEITINRKDRVLRVRGLNGDAGEILADTDYRNWDVRDAVGDLVIRLSDRDYIGRDKRTVLLSVDSRSQGNADRIKRELSDSIEAALDGAGIRPLIVRQSSPRDRSLKEKADEYQISIGKMRLVEEVRRKAPDLDERELARTPVDELYRLLRSGGEEKPDWLEIDGDWDEEMDDDGYEEEEPEADDEDGEKNGSVGERGRRESDDADEIRENGSGGAGKEHSGAGEKDSEDEDDGDAEGDDDAEDDDDADDADDADDHDDADGANDADDHDDADGADDADDHDSAGGRGGANGHNAAGGQVDAGGRDDAAGRGDGDDHEDAGGPGGDSESGGKEDEERSREDQNSSGHDRDDDENEGSGHDDSDEDDDGNDD